jgi:hypothetical protein
MSLSQEATENKAILGPLWRVPPRARARWEGEAVYQGNSDQNAHFNRIREARDLVT